MGRRQRVSTPLVLGSALATVSLTALVSLNRSDEEQGGVFSLTQSAGSLARTVGPALAGQLYVALSYWSPFVVAGAVLVPALIVLSAVTANEVRATAERQRLTRPVPRSATPAC
jgi:predicted MFS family arabinose efflux permease